MSLANKTTSVDFKEKVLDALAEAIPEDWKWIDMISMIV